MESYQIVELATTVLIIIGVGLLSYSPVARGIADRIRHGRTPKPGIGAEPDMQRFDDLSGELASLRQQLEQTQDRLDFTERMIAQTKTKNLGAGRDD